MPKLSNKGVKLPFSPIRKLATYAEKAKSKGVNILHLNIGQPDILSPEVSLDAIHNFPDKVIEYSHSAGFESYRKKLVEKNKEKNELKYLKQMVKKIKSQVR